MVISGNSNENFFNEKEQSEQGKLKFKEKRNPKKWNGAKSCVQEDRQI